MAQDKKVQKKQTQELEKENIYRQTRLEKCHKLRALGFEPYPYKFNASHMSQEIAEKYNYLVNGEKTEDIVSLAGRIMSIRNSGMFIDIKDSTGKIQLFGHKDFLAPGMTDILKLLDIGDIIGVEGKMRRTPRGQLTVNIEKLEVLSKTLLPLPEKYHGLTDQETRYRQRYLDLIMNEESRDKLRLRSQIIHDIRQFLTNKGYLEVETPMLHPIPGGATAKPFVTYHNTLDCELYLRIAPELYLKKLIVGGLSDKIFEINRCFRNEGISTRHNPEFTSVELYAAYKDYNDMMDITEELITFLVKKIHGTMQIKYGDKEIDFSTPWPRKSMCHLVQDCTNVDFLSLDAEAARIKAKELGIEVEKGTLWGNTIEKIFSEKVEPTILNPVHVIDMPLDISPLAKVHRNNPLLSERFETFVLGFELANAFSELNDPEEQRKRFEAQVKAGEDGDEEAQCMDESFLNALDYGMPPTGGLGIGIDRLVMLLTNTLSIRDIIAFPTLRQK